MKQLLTTSGHLIADHAFMPTTQKYDGWYDKNANGCYMVLENDEKGYKTSSPLKHCRDHFLKKVHSEMTSAPVRNIQIGLILPRNAKVGNSSITFLDGSFFHKLHYEFDVHDYKYLSYRKPANIEEIQISAHVEPAKILVFDFNSDEYWDSAMFWEDTKRIRLEQCKIECDFTYSKSHKSWYHIDWYNKIYSGICTAKMNGYTPSNINFNTPGMSNHSKFLDSNSIGKLIDVCRYCDKLILRAVYRNGKLTVVEHNHILEVISSIKTLHPLFYNVGANFYNTTEFPIMSADVANHPVLDKLLAV